MTTPITSQQETLAAASENFEVLLISGDDERPGYSVLCPALPGCISQGDSWDSALMMIKEAIEGFLELGTRPASQENEKDRIISEWIDLGCKVEVATVMVNL